MKEYDENWLRKLDETIDQNLKNPAFNLSELTERISVSPANLYRRTKALTGKSPKAYIRERRLARAKDLLERGVYATIAETALAVGYLHSNNFSVNFEKEYGQRPSAYF